jgi:hypothetical protein
LSSIYAASPKERLRIFCILRAFALTCYCLAQRLIELQLAAASLLSSPRSGAAKRSDMGRRFVVKILL